MFILNLQLVAVLNHDFQSSFETPSETGVVYCNAINPRPAPLNNTINIPSLIQYTALQPPELEGGILRLAHCEKKYRPKHCYRHS